MIRALFLLFGLTLAACSAPPAPQAGGDQISSLTRAFMALSPEVDADEAARAARIAYDYPLQLRAEYGVTDPPLVHNAKVNAGLRPRGLCWHWADDLQARFVQEGFQTLDLHRAIANGDSRLLIDHSTVIVSAKGAAWDEGIVTDPWRYGGRLFWDEVQDDTRYDWVLRQQVFAEKRARRGL
ncbi:MAG: hypothetical protein AAGF60_09780 [Pseudomonadota bacterium]